jgi:hypothetical protein
MYDVFISYARNDRSRAEQFQHAIKRCGWTVWWDADLLPGQQWNDVIEKELRGAGAVLVLWSQDSVKSQFVCDEATIARELGKLVPVTLDGQRPKVGMGQLQLENMSSWDGKEPDHAGLIKVLSGLNQILKTGKIPPPPPEPKRPSYLKVALAAGAAVVVAAAGIIAFPYLSGGTTPAETTAAETTTARTAPPPSPVEPAPVIKPVVPPGGGGGGSTTKRPSTPPSTPTNPAVTKPLAPPPDAAPAAAATAATAAPTAERGCTALIAEARKHSDVAAVFFDLGKCHYDQGRFDDAVRAYDSAIELNGGDPKYFEALGLAKWKNNLAAQGISDVSSAIALSRAGDPNLYSLFESRGKIRFATRDYQRAQDDYDKATRLNPKSKSAWLGLAAAAEKTMSLDIAASARTNADAIP